MSKATRLPAGQKSRAGKTRLAGTPQEAGPTSSATRADDIVRQAAPVFLRYGFRKTSMEDLAAAAELSRPGLYLHFPNKELLFRKVIAYLGGRAVEALSAALKGEGPLEVRLLAGFEAMATTALSGLDPAEVRDLFGSAAELAPEELARIDECIVTSLARALSERAKKAHGRRSGEPSPRDLAEHLYVASYGLQQRGHTGKAYRTRMATAVRIVCSSAND